MNLKAWLVFMVMLTVSVLQGALHTEADSTARYLVMENQLVFRYTDEQPYTILRPMCWNSHTGWCDSGMDERGSRVAYLVDFDLGRHGVIMQNSTLCWVWWFFPEYGADNNPHVEEAYLIECGGGYATSSN
jgi:hypothetical protein